MGGTVVSSSGCTGMSGNTTLYSPMDVLHQQFIVICVVIATAILLLLAILAILISAIIERCRRRREEDQGIECRVFLTEHDGSIIGTIRTGPQSDRGGTYTPRLGLGYEDMSPTGRGGESIYETVQ